MLLILLSSALWLPAVLGFGLPLDALRRRASLPAEPVHFTLAVLGGLVFLGALGSVLNLALPLGPWVCTSLLVLGWVLALRWRRDALALLRAVWPSRRVWPAVLVLAGLGLVVAALTRAWTPWYDTGLYYAQTTKWATEASTPLGLGNLHGRLAFNSIWHMVAAALEIPLLGGRGLLLVNGLAFVAAGVAVLGAARATSMGRGPITTSRVFLMACVVPLLTTLRSETLGSGTPDFAVLLGWLLAMYATVRAVEGTETAGYWWAVAVLIGVGATLAKVSAAPILFVPVIATIWLVRQRGWDSLPGAAVIGVLMAIPVVAWLARGIALSGCPAYPLTVGCVEGLTWAVPLSQANNERLGVLEFARRAGGFTGEALSGWAWLPSWLGAFAANPRTLAAGTLALLGILAFGIAAGRGKAAAPSLRLELIVLSGPLVGLVAWFLFSPNLRFGEGPLWAASLVVLASGTRRFLQVPAAQRVPFRQALNSGLVGLALLATGLALRGIASAGGQALFSWPTVPQVLVDERRTNADARIFTPIEGDQCWLAELPCTPYFNPELSVLGSPTEAFPREFRAPGR